MIGKSTDLNILTWVIGTARRLYVAQLPRPTTKAQACITSESHTIQTHIDLSRLMENIYAPGADSVNVASNPAAFIFENPVALREEQLDDYIEIELLIFDNVKYQVGPHLSESEKHAIRDAADELRPLWSLNKTDLGRIKGHGISIDIDGPPIRQAPYQLSETQNDFLMKWCKAMVDIGIIRRSSSSWAAATLLPPKKDDNGNVTDLRVIHEYRPYNAMARRRLRSRSSRAACGAP